jgi:cytochrome c553
MAAAPDPAGVEFYEKNVRPVFADNCYRCHSTSAPKVRGGLYLDSLTGILKGGEDGAVIIPGDPDKSPLISAIRREDKDTAMPPKTPLEESAVLALTQWVKMGAPGPADIVAAPGKAAPPRDPTAEYDRLRHELWSWQSIKNPAVPTGPDDAWASNNIDRFVLAKLEESDLHPSAKADKVTLIRRATFDLIGLPPTPAEVDAFVKDSSPDAFSKVVDRLLASPHFGERWGRHWLDVARYGESTGMTRNLPYFYAWRYRDYVISAFNQDKPFNRFITEQIAGDQLPAANDAQRDQLTIATGFLAIGPKDYNEKNQQQFLMNNVDEQIDVTGRALLATTIACARCHDHKFDPIPTKEYYSLAGIFRSTQTFTGLQRLKMATPQNVFDPDLLIRLSDYHASATPAADEILAQQQLQQLQQQRRLLRLQQQQGQGLQAQQLRQLAVQYQAANQPITVEALAMGAKDVLYPSDAQVLVRGDLTMAGPSVSRGFLTIPSMTDVPAVDPRHSGRLELADWITRTDNPLTSRVIVNRIWRHLFGEGIVRTVDNFGMSGEKPSNPQLLDYLATNFMQDGWSMKKTIRTIMLSSTYQQSSNFDKDKFAVDPDNRLLWRQTQRRLEAEPIRDAMLWAAGNLNPNPMVGSQVTQMGPGGLIRAAKRGFEPDSENAYRSIYLPVFRSAMPEVLDTFDVADPDFVTGDRDVTTVAPQALFMLNSPFAMNQAARMAARLETEGHSSVTGEIALAYRLALGREPSASERSQAEAFVSAFARDDRAAPTRRTHDGLAAFCQALFASAEFRYVN